MAKNKTYSDLLRHPQWQMKRLEILKRDKGACKLCDDKETELHVHHKKYRSNSKPWEYDNDDLITYCKHCHAMVEDLKESVELLPLMAKKRYPGDFNVYLYLFVYNTKDSSIYMFRYTYDEDSNLLKYMYGITEEGIDWLKAGVKEARRKCKKIFDTQLT